MKEKIHTIPVNEAFASGDECPFCYLERETEQRTIRYAIGPGASYMEPEVRAVTDREGFCGEHLKKLYDYGNALGCALILQTYYVGMMRELEQELDNYELPEKRSFFRKKPAAEGPSSLQQWLAKREKSCYICNRLQENMDRYYETFFVLLKDPEFRSAVERSKGLCLPHFRKLMEMSSEKLHNAQREWFRETVFSLMWENLVRVKEDLDWFVAKNDFRNAGLDWKNSKDAVTRSMQKLQGGHPSDPVFKNADFGIRK